MASEGRQARRDGLPVARAAQARAPRPATRRTGPGRSGRCGRARLEAASGEAGVVGRTRIETVEKNRNAMAPPERTMTGRILRPGAGAARRPPGRCRS